MAKKLVVIDGKSVFYRGYYAVPNLATPDGTPTSGVYGFAVMALRILDLLKPDYVIVAWDKSKTNIRARRKLYKEYKANRKPMPDDLRAQIPILRQLLAGFNWPLLEIDDFEADDIMATLSKQARKKGLKTVLVTSDLDILQAVNGGTDVLALKRGLTNVINYDRAKFTEEYGLTPEQFIDYKALRGDPSDNVPGVAGIGDKSARQLIKEHGSLDGVYANLDKIKPAWRTKLETGKDMAYLSHKLLEIRFDAPVKLNLKAANATEAKPAEIAELFDRLRFRSLLAHLPAHMATNAQTIDKSKKPIAKPSKFGKVDVINAKHLDEATYQLLNLEDATEMVFYTLIDNRDKPTLGQIKGWLISAKPGHCLFIDATLIKPSEISKKIEKLITKLPPLIGYNLKADMRSLLQLGGPLPKVGFDTMVAAFLINPLFRQRSLTELAKNYLETDLETDGLAVNDAKTWAYGITETIWELASILKKELSKTGKLDVLANEIEWPLVPVLAKIEHAGIKLDTKYLANMSTELTKRLNDVKEIIYKEAKTDFNIASPQQLAHVLFDKLQLTTKGIKKTTTGYSTAASELEKLRGLHPIISLITEYRELAKLKSTYIDALPKLVDGKSRLHTSFNQVVAQTGRLSSEAPNLQNIPIRTEIGKKIRKAFVVEPGNALISADYSQFELRLAAVLANDANMIHAFNKGIDIHAMTAAELYDLDLDMVTNDQRRAAKTVNFGVLYGLSAHGLSQATGMSRPAAQDFIKRYFELRQKLLKYMEGLKRKAKTEGYVETLFGRRRPTPDVKSPNWVVRAAAERAAMNMPIQGTAADIMKLAMIKIDAKLPKDCQMILQIHDSVLVECPKNMAEKTAQLLKTEMEGAHKLSVKLEVDTKIGNTWGEL